MQEDREVITATVPEGPFAPGREQNDLVLLMVSVTIGFSGHRSGAVENQSRELAGR